MLPSVVDKNLKKSGTWDNAQPKNRPRYPPPLPEMQRYKFRSGLLQLFALDSISNEPHCRNKYILKCREMS